MDTLRVGHNIKKWRQFKGYKQEHLAILINISRSTLSRLENGKGEFDLYVIKKIAEELNVEVKHLIVA